jgi:hypothetical protein
LSGCRLCGCVDERGDLAQCGYQVIEFGRGGNSVTGQCGDTKVFGVVGGEIRERNATAVNLGNRAIAIYGCDFSPSPGTIGVAAIFRKVGGNGKVGKGGQRLLIRGRDGTRGAAPAIVVETPEIDGGVSGVAGQVISKRFPPSRAIGGSITDEGRGALALQVRLNIAGCCLNEGGGGT